MLDPSRYLLGVAEILLLVGFATLGAAALRARLLPAFSGASAHLATGVLALALLILPAELLGSFGLLEPVPYLAGVAVVSLGVRLLLMGGWGRPPDAAASSFSPRMRLRTASCAAGGKPSKAGGRPHPPSPASVVAAAIAAIAVVKFGLDLKPKLTTGMTGFDSTWYHAPFAAGFAQSGDTWGLHFIAPQFLAWFYPANAEVLHGVGMLAFGRDVLSPLLNLGWFVGCLAACWCIGRPYKVAPWSLALGAVALSLPVLSDQAGEARNDIVGIFFLLAAVAVALNARAAGSGGGGGEGAGAGRTTVDAGGSVERDGSLSLGAVVVIGLAAGLAAGTKLNFLLPAAVLVFGLPFVALAGDRWRTLLAGTLAALVGGGYWYLRNLVHSGNPLPWFDSIGPVSLPAPDQPLGGREGHSVLGYLTDGGVWSEWLLPGLHDGLTIFWPLLGAAALAGLLLCLAAPARAWSRLEPDSDPKLDRDRVLSLVGLVGLAVIAAWLIAPTSASGPDGIPRGFESGLRYLAPALVLGLSVLPAAILAVLPSALLPRVAWGGAPGKARRPLFRPTDPASDAGDPRRKTQRRPGAPPHDRTRGPQALIAAVVLLIAIGYPVQRHYLENRYANPNFAAPGLNAAFKWATPLTNARIATTSTRQYPLFGTDLTNHVRYIGEPRSHGGFTAPTTCRQWRRLLNEGNYDYAITTRDRVEPNKPPYPATSDWTEGPGAKAILRQPPTVIYKLTAPLDPPACP